jgi:hypothetical protein
MPKRYVGVCFRPVIAGGSLIARMAAQQARAILLSGLLINSRCAAACMQ